MTEVNCIENFFVITGAPGVGKTTLISKLAERLLTVGEPAREVIAEQKAENGAGLWDKDRALFIDLLVKRSIEKFAANQLANPDRVVFFDRGLPDNIAYAASGKAASANCKVMAQKYRYNPKVFILPPWKEIYTTDDERNMPFSAVLQFHDLIVSSYLDQGYDLVEVPLAPVEKRVDFILSYLSAMGLTF